MHKDVPNILLDVLHIADSATSVNDQQNEDSKERVVFGFIAKECEKVESILLMECFFNRFLLIAVSVR